MSCFVVASVINLVLCRGEIREGDPGRGACWCGDWSPCQRRPGPCGAWTCCCPSTACRSPTTAPCPSAPAGRQRIMHHPPVKPSTLSTNHTRGFKVVNTLDQSHEGLQGSQSTRRQGMSPLHPLRPALRTGERIHYHYLVSQKYTGETAKAGRGSIHHISPVPSFIALSGAP